MLETEEQESLDNDSSLENIHNNMTSTPILLSSDIERRNKSFLF